MLLESSKLYSIYLVIMAVCIYLQTAIKNLKMNLIERIKAPTPHHFKRLRNVGLALAAAGTVLVTTPIVIPSVVVTIGGYLIVAGAVASAVAQTAVFEVEDEE